MVRKFSELTVNDLDVDMMVDIELFVKNLMIVWAGDQTGMENIINTEEVVMLDTTQTDPSTVQIKLADEQRDAVNLEEGIMVDMDRAGDSMDIGHSGEEAVEMDTLPEVGVMLMSSDSEDHSEMEPGVG